ncbi:aspartyl-phosphate phosphatase Spo0E family protein [Bacillus sp. ISL-4]|uniref:aspartyl-phosphate phosphatase Spo0E family protein n=1 Tax=Bacillus sp. ISL-4 TaxID=2819125 RepID=UPI001BEB05DE|nr:aspartyl-phosphate phosphatase Spo0E family protein [Bacillus sp. ISL-4]MBT2668707.1 aspartyl-phosphate phosphatase Spo0E family protein [Bacillus sp. ISL-4]
MPWSIKINQKRNEMIFLGNQYGLNSPEVIKVSRQLDDFLNKLYDYQKQPRIYTIAIWKFMGDITRKSIFPASSFEIRFLFAIQQTGRYLQYVFPAFVQCF